jgi:diguanylate cyclase (GGDEF)-like protein
VPDDPEVTIPALILERPTRPEGARSDRPGGGACLVLIYGQDIGRRIPLGTSSLVVGRSPRCDLVLDEDSVSRQHSRIAPAADGKGHEVSDMGSTNGTYVNDVVVQSHRLRHGDRVQVGRNILKFLESGHLESAYHEEVYHLMTTDGLTQLMNRRAFEDAMAREFARSQRHDRPLTVLMIDIDHFKKVNDTFGHLAGDGVLRQLGLLLHINLRRNDLIGRLGGEEFAVALPEVGPEGAQAAATKVLKLVAAHPFEFDGSAIPITISIGLTTRQAHDTEATDLIRRADECLLEAKRAGRNCIRS